MQYRRLTEQEVDKVWEIERREIVQHVYVMVNDRLQLREQFYDTRGWPEGEEAEYGPILRACFERGGLFLGAFEGDELAAVSVMDSRPVTDYPKLHQLAFLHVSHGWRGQGLASELYARTRAEAEAMGIVGFYISATSTQRTVEFYLSRGAELSLPPDRELYEKEPDDIHLAHWFY